MGKTSKIIVTYTFYAIIVALLPLLFRVHIFWSRLLADISNQNVKDLLPFLGPSLVGLFLFVVIFDRLKIRDFPKFLIVELLTSLVLATLITFSSHPFGFGPYFDASFYIEAWSIALFLFIVIPNSLLFLVIKKLG